MDYHFGNPSSPKIQQKKEMYEQAGLVFTNNLALRIQVVDDADRTDETAEDALALQFYVRRPEMQDLLRRFRDDSPDLWGEVISTYALQQGEAEAQEDRSDQARPKQIVMDEAFRRLEELGGETFTPEFAIALCI